MDKRLQDIKILIDNPIRDSEEEIFVFRAVQLMEMLKKPTYLILRIKSETTAINEIIIPIIPFLKVIIE